MNPETRPPAYQPNARAVSIKWRLPHQPHIPALYPRAVTLSLRGGYICQTQCTTPKVARPCSHDWTRDFTCLAAGSNTAAAGTPDKRRLVLRGRIIRGDFPGCGRGGWNQRWDYSSIQASGLILSQVYDISRSLDRENSGLTVGYRSHVSQYSPHSLGLREKYVTAHKFAVPASSVSIYVIPVYIQHFPFNLISQAL